MIEAFRRLTATFYGALSFKLPPSPGGAARAAEEGRAVGRERAAAQASASRHGRAGRPLEARLRPARHRHLRRHLPAARLDGTRRSTASAAWCRRCARPSAGRSSRSCRASTRSTATPRSARTSRCSATSCSTSTATTTRRCRSTRPTGRTRATATSARATAFPTRRSCCRRRICSPTCSRASRRRRSSRASQPAAVDQDRRRSACAARAASSPTAEAFRIYRFRDGAWSEIILGAVMGAARRVEAEKRRRRVEDDIFETPRADARAGAAARTSASRTVEATDQHPADAALRAAAHPHPPAFPYPAYPYVVGGTASARGPHPAMPGFEGYPAPVQPAARAGADMDGWSSPPRACKARQCRPPHGIRQDQFISRPMVRTASPLRMQRRPRLAAATRWRGSTRRGRAPARLRLTPRRCRHGLQTTIRHLHIRLRLHRQRQLEAKPPAA